MSAHRDPQRIALIGYGLAGSVFHAPLIAMNEGLTLAAIVTGNVERAADAHERYPDAEIVASTEALWRRAAEFDAVVVAAPNGAHAALAQQAVDHGLAVVVDKPLAADTADAQALIDTAEKAGVPLTVFHNRRWDSDFRTVSQLLEQGQLGTIRRFESRFERWRPEAKPGWKRDVDPRAAGGILFDLGSHLIDQALALFGPAHQVYAELMPRYTDDGVDDDSFVALTHANGVLSHLWMSSVAPSLGPRFRIQGSLAGYEKYGLDPQEDALRDGAWPGTHGWGREPTEAHGELINGDTHEVVASLPGDYPAFYQQFAEALAGEATLPVDPRDALASLAVIEAARTSAAEGRVVRP